MIFAPLLIVVLAVVLVMGLYFGTGSRVEGSAAVALVPEQPLDTRRIELREILNPLQEAWTMHSTGKASYYGPGFAGRATANGEVFRPLAMTAAHRTLPFGTKLRVTNLRNGKSVIVRVNDRGPYAGARILDLSEGAASRIGMLASGTAHVRLEVMT